jgi:hypothetical protein
MDTEGTGVTNIMLKAVIAIAAILVVVLIFVGPGQKSSGPKQPAQSTATSEVDEISSSKQPVKATATPRAAESGSTKQPVESAGASGDKHFHPKGMMPSKFTEELQKNFEEQKKGFIAAPDYKQIKAEAGHVAWDMGSYEWLLQGKDFDSIHPSLQRQAILNMNYGLYEQTSASSKVRPAGSSLIR